MARDKAADARERLQAVALASLIGASDQRRAQLRNAAIGHVTRTLSFLEVAIEDVDQAQRAMLDFQQNTFLPMIQSVHDEASELSPGETREMTADEVALFDELSRRNYVLQFRIETFYFFARRLLDDVAVALDTWFGPSETTIGGHRRLAKNLPLLVKEHDLVPPAESFFALVDAVTRRIKVFRDQHVAHIGPVDNVRKWRAIHFGRDGGARLSIGWLYPASADDQIESEDVAELLHLLVTYLNAVTVFLATNSGSEASRPSA